MGGGSQDSGELFLHVIGVVGDEYLWMIGKTGLLFRNIHSTLLSLSQDVKFDHGTFFGR